MNGLTLEGDARRPKIRGGVQTFGKTVCVPHGVSLAASHAQTASRPGIVDSCSPLPAA